ncbi:50S ribosomal protein L25 [Candidatus Saccharibacteria bacterium]|nr:50S ribosomal protein L25 [Candidatus Saccharibacteria bacterium]
MGDKITLKLTERTVHGKKVKALRREGVVPAVVYGPGMEPLAVQVDQVLMGKVYAAAGKHAPVHLTIGDKKRIAMIKDVEVDNVKRRINHVSFHAVSQNKPVEAEVPIRLVGEGESEAERNGLIVLQTLEKIEVKALPLDLPEALEVSILHLKEAGERILVGDIKVPDNVEIVDNDDGHGDEDEEEDEANDIFHQVVASVWEPSALQAQNDAAAGDAEDVSEVAAEQGAEAPAENTEAGSEEKKD